MHKTMGNVLKEHPELLLACGQAKFTLKEITTSDLH